MTDINRITIIGRVTADAELKTFDSGYGVLNFTIASNRSYKKNDEWVEEASFIPSKYFSKGAAKLSEFVKKGTQVAIEGQLVQENWEKDGQKKSRLVVQADSIQLVGGRPTQQTAPASNNTSNGGFPEDYPF